jgi:hypothetical protein
MGTTRAVAFGDEKPSSQLAFSFFCATIMRSPEPFITLTLMANAIGWALAQPSEVENEDGSRREAGPEDAFKTIDDLAQVMKDQFTLAYKSDAVNTKPV